MTERYLKCINCGHLQRSHVFSSEETKCTVCNKYSLLAIPQQDYNIKITSRENTVKHILKTHNEKKKKTTRRLIQRR